MIDTNALFENLMKAGGLLRRQSQPHGPQGNPAWGQGRVLALLAIKPVISQRQLCYLLQLRPQSLGELLVKLEKLAYIERETDPDDRRGQLVKLTEAGRAAAEAAAQSDDRASLFSALTEEEQETLSVLMEKLTQDWQARMPDEPPRGHHHEHHGPHHEDEGEPRCHHHHHEDEAPHHHGSHHAHRPE